MDDDERQPERQREVQGSIYIAAVTNVDDDDDDDGQLINNCRYCRQKKTTIHEAGQIDFV